MNPERWQQVSEILDQALRLPDDERPVYLAQIKTSDPELHREVNSLLASHAQAGSGFLNTLAANTESAPRRLNRDSRVGRRLGPYLIVELIGTGGMGEVYRAVRADDQYQKQVALKLVRPGYDSSFVIHRFKNERQILASLDHPNIARLLDGGTTEEGIPYFVMELIEGKMIDRYCNDHQLATAERLKLFLQVCSAVQLAHQRLIVHRDLKPGNILVTADGVPRLLDFGIAKLLDPGDGSGGGGTHHDPDPVPGVYPWVRQPGANQGRTHHDRKRRLFLGSRAVRVVDRLQSLWQDEPHAPRDRTRGV